MIPRTMKFVCVKCGYTKVRVVSCTDHFMPCPMCKTLMSRKMASSFDKATAPVQEVVSVIGSIFKKGK